MMMGVCILTDTLSVLILATIHSKNDELVERMGKFTISQVRISSRWLR